MLRVANIFTSLSQFPFILRTLDSRYIATGITYLVLTPFNMELRSRHLAEVEVGDPDPGVPGPSPLELSLIHI